MTTSEDIQWLRGHADALDLAANVNHRPPEEAAHRLRDVADALERLTAANVMGDSCRRAYPKLEEEAGRLGAEVVTLKAKLEKTNLDLSGSYLMLKQSTDDRDALQAKLAEGGPRHIEDAMEMRAGVEEALKVLHSRAEKAEAEAASLLERMRKLEAVVTALHNQHPINEDLHPHVNNALAALEEKS